MTTNQVPKPVKFTREVAEQINEAAKRAATRDYVVVNVNLSKRSAVITSESDAPLLTAGVLLEKGDPTDTVIMDVGANSPLELEILKGIPFHVEAAQLRLVSQNKDLSDTELEIAEARLLATKLITFPKFSYKSRKRKGVIPLEDYPDDYLSVLMMACDAVNNPESDDVYQVRIRRDYPVETDKRVMAVFKRFPKATQWIARQPALLTPQQAKMVEHLRSALREIVLEDLVISPNLFLNNSKKERIDDGFPISVLAESIQQTLFSAVCIAHKLPNIL